MDNSHRHTRKDNYHDLAFYYLCCLFSLILSHVRLPLKKGLINVIAHTFLAIPSRNHRVVSGRLCRVHLRHYHQSHSLQAKREISRERTEEDTRTRKRRNFMIRCPRCNMKVFSLHPVHYETHSTNVCRVCLPEVEMQLEHILLETYFQLHPDKLLRLRHAHAVREDC